MMSIFAGTAAYYDDFRPGVPPEVVDCIISAVARSDTLLDLGSGTGRITEQFASYFREIIAVEPDAEMTTFARRRLARFPATVLHTTAEEMSLPDGWQASVCTISRAFHWMDRPKVLHRLEQIMASDGVIAIFSDDSFWHVTSDWATVMKKTLARFIGPERRTTMGAYKPPRDYFSENFSSSVFTQLEYHTIPVVRTWTADQIIGYLYSTSFASHAVLGDKAPAFERELRQGLARLSPSNYFTEHNHFDILLARRG